MPIDITCFKAYDIRGRIPDQINEDIAWRIGNATAEFLGAKRVVIGRDMRLSSAGLTDAVARGLTEAGVEVLDIGLCGTEMVYFAVTHLGADGGIMVTASHNPADYNGLKLVREQAKPISADTGLKDIRKLAEADRRLRAASPGKRSPVRIFDAYVEHMLGYVDVSRLEPLKLVVNAGNGCAGIAIDGLEPHLPFEFIKIHHEPDGTFPNGIPNPLLPENRASTAEAVVANGADMGIAWDGDFDRCFLFDEKAGFIEGYYIVGLLAESLLEKHPGGKIVHDPRLTWNTLDMVEAAGGVAVQSKSGHSFIKETMRRVDGIYGGEMSAHHYFRDFSYADSGMIPWLLVAELLCKTGKPLSALVGERIAKYPASGEINREVADAKATLKALHDRYAKDALAIDDTDGYSFEFPDWRFNIRMSNTEPVVRLNVESRGDQALMEAKTAEVLAIMES
ncbi:MAG: phosphomannomutase [Gammaproteobacteria bacterium]|nr:phosphomannomutase [Gammaproteobacteria bacterium]MDH5239239.1 phosphomannomutase [Gammaproteobacteria bacterium]MDH5259896.1 phosphomannomutase [Gammaproteobacteria bacterium]